MEAGVRFPPKKARLKGRAPWWQEVFIELQKVMSKHNWRDLQYLQKAIKRENQDIVQVALWGALQEGCVEQMLSESPTINPPVPIYRLTDVEFIIPEALKEQWKIDDRKAKAHKFFHPENHRGYII